MKITRLQNLIRKILNESPSLYDPHQDTIDRRMYKNKLSSGSAYKYPRQSEIDHEIMRIEKLWEPSPKQYDMRLTKITKSQKMYNAYISILAYLKKNPDKRFKMEKTLDKVRYYLRKNGLGDMLVGKGGHSPIALTESVDIKTVAEDIARNYKRITGTDLKKLIDDNGDFDQYLVDKDYEKIQKYVSKNYPDFDELKGEEDLLFAIDDELLKIRF